MWKLFTLFVAAFRKERSRLTPSTMPRSWSSPMLLSTPSASAQRRRQTPSSLRPLLPTLEKCRHHNLLTLIHYSSSARSLRAVSNMSIAELMLMKAQKMQKLCKLLGNQVWTQNTSLPPPPGKKGFCLKRKCKNLFIDHILLLPFPACPLPNFPN